MAADRIKECPIKSAVFTTEKALALMLDASLSKQQYEVVRKATKDFGYDIFSELQ